MSVHTYPAQWVPVADVLTLLQDPRWSWLRNNPCKYVRLHLDTRDMRCLIADRDGRSITLHELSRQLDSYLVPATEPVPLP